MENCFRNDRRGHNRLDVALDGSDATKETIQAALSSAELNMVRFSIYAPAG